MKRLALVTLSLSLALTHFAAAADNDPGAAMQQAKQNAVASKKGRGPGQRGNARMQANQRNVNPAARSQFRTQRNAGNPGFNPGVNAQARIGRDFTPRVRTQNMPQVNSTLNRDGDGRTRSWSNRDGNDNWRDRNWNGNDGLRNRMGNGNEGLRNRFGNGNRNWKSPTGRQWNRQGHGGHNWDRTRRDRNYWRSNYSRFALFGGGYYYWNSGFWYPAYGYDPYFSNYTYDAPIYGYNDLEPGQVIANVQAELQRAGYYRGGLDGQFGPMTRQALLNYQGDNGLPVTGEIDEDTLDSLGLQ